MELFGQMTGYLLLATYTIGMVLVAYMFCRKGGKNKDEFLVASRSIGGWKLATTIAATWIWAPALFISAEQAFRHGLAGVFWFTVPNVLTLIIFGYIAIRLKRVYKEGYTISGFMMEKYSKRVNSVYLFQVVGLTVCSFAVQLLAGAYVISFITGIPFMTVTIILTAIALMYSFTYGLRASIVTDHIQMLLIAFGCLFIVPYLIYSTGGISTVVAGLGGTTGEYGNVFSTEGLHVFWVFGLMTTIGLLAGPYGDQTFWQRVFSTSEREIKRGFTRGALIFAIVPVMMSMIGFVAAGTNLNVVNTGYVNIETVVAFLPDWIIIIFVFMVLSGLMSTMDSKLCAISAIAGHDLVQRFSKGKSEASVLSYARYAMVLLAIGGILIANIPGMQILYLFLFYGTLRASTMIPTVLTILQYKLHEAGVFYGVIGAYCIGLPIFVYGQMNGLVMYSVTGSVLTIVLSGTIALIISKRRIAHEN